MILNIVIGAHNVVYVLYNKVTPKVEVVIRERRRLDHRLEILRVGGVVVGKVGTNLVVPGASF